MPNNQILRNDVIKLAVKHRHYVEYPYAKSNTAIGLSVGFAVRTRAAVCVSNVFVNLSKTAAYIIAISRTWCFVLDH